MLLALIVQHGMMRQLSYHELKKSREYEYSGVTSANRLAQLISKLALDQNRVLIVP
ncbi:hypothetical protein AADZ86_10470 [Colwelliaceae bacterium BS250]